MKEYKLSLLSLLALLFLLPLFFVPSLSVPLTLAKPVLLFIGVFVGFISLLAFVLKRGELRVPRSKLVWAVVLLPIVYFVSAFFSGSSSFGLYGYNFEVGTFVSILLASVVLLLAAIVADDTARVLKLESAIFCSPPLGDWSDLGIALALLAILSLLAVEMLEMTSVVRGVVYGVLVLSVVLLAIVNFSTAWWIVMLASLIIMIYFITMEKPTRVTEGEQTVRRISRVAVAVFAVSLLFVFNPTVSPTHGTLGNTISSLLNVSTSNVSPALSSTLSVTGPVLKTHPLLGSGPNTFANDWLLYKPVLINQSNFWNTPFTFGLGFIFTQIASVGLLGSLLWLVVIVLLLMLAGKVLVRMSPSTSM